MAAIATGYSVAMLVPVAARPAGDERPASGAERSGFEVAAAAGSGTVGSTASTTEVPRASTTTASTAPPRIEFTLAVTGDVLLHSPVSRQAAEYGRASGAAYDYRPMFDRVRAPLTGADLALCHLETPLSTDDTGLSTYPSFSVPWEIAHALADAGYDGCSTASNHSLDRGSAGVAATLDHLDFTGVGHAGTARSAEEAAAPRLYDVRGAKVGHLAYTDHLNGRAVPGGEPWLVARIDAARILTDAAALRAAGSQFTVVSLHWGAEFVSDPTAAQQEVAVALLASPDVDLVVGHHAHVVQPVQQINGKWVAYGLGNFLSNQFATRCCPAESQDGVIVRFNVGETAGGGFAVESVDFVPTYVDRSTYRILAAADSISDPALDPSTRSALARSLERTVEVVNRGGADLAASGS